MRANTKAIARAFAEIFDVKGPIVEVGALQVDGQHGWGDLRECFSGIPYVGTDMRAGPGVDRVENFEGPTSFADGEAGTIISLDTLEHVYDVFAFMRELDRILAPDGLMLLTSVMYYPVHAHPSDYWRFTPEALRRMAAAHGDCCVLAQGPGEFPHTVAAVLCKGALLDPETVRRFREAVASGDGVEEGCGWVHPREEALAEELKNLRAYHARWGCGGDDAAFDPDMTRRVFASCGADGAVWAGLPTGASPGDLMVLQEIIAEQRPGVVIAPGVRPGMRQFLKDMLRLAGEGRVLDAGPEAKAEATRAKGPVMTVLQPEGNARAALDDMLSWAPPVSNGAYLVVFNTARRYLADMSGGSPEWADEGPFHAVQRFLMARPDFAADRSREKYAATFAPLGFLCRRQAPDASGWRAHKATLEQCVGDAGQKFLRCTTYEGKDGVWGGLLLGCERTNQCDGKSLPCAPAAPMELRLFLRGAVNHDRARLALNVIDDTGVRLAETLLSLPDAWTELAFPFATRADSRFLGVQLVKAKDETPVVFEVRGTRLVPRDSSTA